MAAEYRVRYHLILASYQGKMLEEIVYNPQAGVTFGRFCSLKKKMFYHDQEKMIEVDIFCVSESDDGRDLVVEVKDWETKINPQVIGDFITKRQQLDHLLTKKTAYIFYSEQGIGEKEKEMLDQNGIMYSDGEKLRQLEKH